MKDIEAELARKSRALVAISVSACNYANLHNHYVRVGQWGKAVEYEDLIRCLGYAVSYIDDFLELAIYLNADGEQINRISIESDGKTIGLPWDCVVVGDDDDDMPSEYWKEVK